MTDKKYAEDREQLLFFHVDDSDDKARIDKHKMRRFWFAIAPISGLAALFVTIVSDKNIFWPLWLFLAIVGGCWGQSD